MHPNITQFWCGIPLNASRGRFIYLILDASYGINVMIFYRILCVYLCWWCWLWFSTLCFWRLMWFLGTKLMNGIYDGRTDAETNK